MVEDRRASGSIKAAEQRLIKAKNRAISMLTQIGYKAFHLPAIPFNVIAVRKREIRWILVLTDEITKDDEEAVKEFEVTDCCSREIWLKEFNKPGFRIRKYE